MAQKHTIFVFNISVVFQCGANYKMPDFKPNCLSISVINNLFQERVQEVSSSQLPELKPNNQELAALLPKQPNCEAWQQGTSAGSDMCSHSRLGTNPSDSLYKQQNTQNAELCAAKSPTSSSEGGACGGEMQVNICKLHANEEEDTEVGGACAKQADLHVKLCKLPSKEVEQEGESVSPPPSKNNLNIYSPDQGEKPIPEKDTNKVLCDKESP